MRALWLPWHGWILQALSLLYPQGLLHAPLRHGTDPPQPH